MENEEEEELDGEDDEDTGGTDYIMPSCTNDLPLVVDYMKLTHDNVTNTVSTLHTQYNGWTVIMRRRLLQYK